MAEVPRSRQRTLVGSGWLREAPQNLRAAMKRRMYAPAFQVFAPILPVSHRRSSHGALPAAPKADAKPRAVAPTAPMPPVGPPSYLLPHHASPAPRFGPPPALPAPWWDDPVVVGALLILVPPIGLSALWASRHHTREARWAITGVLALFVCLGAFVLAARG